MKKGGSFFLSMKKVLKRSFEIDLSLLNFGQNQNWNQTQRKQKVELRQSFPIEQQKGIKKVILSLLKK